MDAIKEESVAFLFNLDVQVEEAVEPEVETAEAGLLAGADSGEVVGEVDGAVAHGSAANGAATNGAATHGAGAPIGLDKPAAEEHHPVIRAKGLDAPRTPTELTYTAPSEQGGAEVSQTSVAVEDEFDGIARNALCPCGSGKKYKKCHGAPGGPTGLTARVS
jgi:preprotein translocase subunit SecA